MCACIMYILSGKVITPLETAVELLSKMFGDGVYEVYGAGDTP